MKDYNSFLELVKSRQSDRTFDASRQVEEEKLTRILEAARLSPSACNAQPWKFIVVNDPILKNQVADCTSSTVLNMNHFTKQAPVHIVIVEEPANFSSRFGSLVKKKEFPQIDIGIAAAHLCLAAQAEGVGSCIIGWVDEAKLQKLLDIPSNKRIRLDVILGYSTQQTREKKRKESDSVISFNKY
ncbi:MAG: nitroreductase family protein [Bacteroidales bacterium]|nr:nitroreductase family protein [Bacteroidales bacterium]